MSTCREWPVEILLGYGLVIIIILLAILICTYAAQKWAYRCHQQLEELNKKVLNLINQEK